MAPSRPPTLQTIADAVGVSRTTVSNAYNRPDQLAPALRERILATARQLGYSGPDPAARRLRSGRRDAVGLLLTDGLSHAFTDPAAGLLLQGIARTIESAGLALLLVPGHGGVQDAVVQSLCIYALPERHPSVVAALERRLPLVAVDEPRLADHAYVGIEDRRGARQAAEHLLALGHRRFALLCGTSATQRERLAGYRDAVEAIGALWSAPEPGELARALVADDRPTALLVGSDQLALHALEAARDAGLVVPHDLSIVGFDDIPAAAWSVPALTTVRQPLLRKGEIAGRMLTTVATAAREVVLPVELVVRGSTARPN
jgi:DNA-binding LacI/PurR family transcriptional regulator